LAVIKAQREVGEVKEKKEGFEEWQEVWSYQKKVVLNEVRMSLE
jgi:hypothetical protein